jgi:hypothetical protein
MLQLNNKKAKNRKRQVFILHFQAIFVENEDLALASVF